MGIVAVAAFNQVLVHTMPKRAVEFGARLGVTLIAKLGLLFYQQRFFLPSFVGRMTGRAPYVRAGMWGTSKIALFVTGGVTFQAAFRCFLITQLSETNDFGNVATTLDVRLPWPVATFTSLMRCVGFFVQHG